MAQAPYPKSFHKNSTNVNAHRLMEGGAINFEEGARE